MPGMEVSARDRVAHRLANAALRIATPWYRDMIEGSIRYGLKSAALDAERERGAVSLEQALRAVVEGWDYNVARYGEPFLMRERWAMARRALEANATTRGGV